MRAEKASHSVRALCRALDVSPSGFYAWQRRPDSARRRHDQQLRIALRVAHAESEGSYGSPRLHRAVRAAGWRVGRNRVIRLMQHEQLVGRPPRRWPATTTIDPLMPAAPNHLAQRFTAPRRNYIWAGDITAIPTREGWLYLAVLLDLYSRRVVGWAVDRTMDTRLVLTAWHRAVALRRTAPRLHHSDRGTQYTSRAYQAALRAHRVRCSMSGRGRCYDNAVVESFFRTLKTDLQHRVWATRTEARAHLSTYIEAFYNRRRLHSTLGYRSPADFERRRHSAA
jgi:transposase InsO family protein